MPFIYRMSWYEAGTSMYFSKAEHTHWGWGCRNHPHGPCRVELINVCVNSHEYDSATRSSAIEDAKSTNQVSKDHSST